MLNSLALILAVFLVASTEPLKLKNPGCELLPPRLNGGIKNIPPPGPGVFGGGGCGGGGFGVGVVIGIIGGGVVGVMVVVTEANPCTGITALLLLLLGVCIFLCGSDSLNCGLEIGL